MRNLRKPIDIKLLEKLYIKEGKSSIDISKILNVPISRICYQLNYYGFQLRHSGSMGNETRIKKEDLYKLYITELKTLKEIGLIYKVSGSTVRNFMIKLELGKYLSKNRPKFKNRGLNNSSKRLEVRNKMKLNHADFSGNKNPNFNNHKLSGENNPNWQGGLSNHEYSWKFNKHLKKQIRKRDNYTCQNCNMTEEEHLDKYYEFLHIHHIDYDKNNCKKDNLITLCLRCNLRANFNRNKWTGIFKERI